MLCVIHVEGELICKSLVGDLGEDSLGVCMSAAYVIFGLTVARGDVVLCESVSRFIELGILLGALVGS